MGNEKEEVWLTLVKIGDWRLALLLELLLSILLVGVVSLHVVPSIELEDVVFCLQIAGPKLKGISPLHVVLGVMAPVRRRYGSLGGLGSGRCIRLLQREVGGLVSQLLLDRGRRQLTRSG